MRDDRGSGTPGPSGRVHPGVYGMIARMRPTLPDSPALTALRETSPEDRAAEVRRAKAFVQAAQLYLSWAEMGERLAAVFDALATGKAAPSEALPVLAASSVSLDAGFRPSLRQSILAVMAEDPERTWKKSEIMAQLKNHGWEPRGGKPSSQLATRLSEMRERGEVHRESVGYYRLAGSAYFQARLVAEASHEAPG